MNNEKITSRLKTIMQRVNKTYNLTISRKTRGREYVYARAVYYKLARELTNYSLSQIGLLVYKDHASVLHGLKTFELLNLWNETEYTEPYERIFVELKNDLYFRDMSEWTNKDKFYSLLNHHIELKQKYKDIKTFMNIEFEHFLATAKESYGYVPTGIKEKYNSVKRNLGVYEKEITTAD